MTADGHAAADRPDGAGADGARADGARADGARADGARDQGVSGPGGLPPAAEAADGPHDRGGPAAARGDGARADGAPFTPEEAARGRALRRAQWPPVLAGRAVGLGVLLALGFTSAGARLVDVGGPWWAEALWAAVVLVLLGQAVRLPFSARATAARRRFGLVTQGWPGWWADVLRGLLIALPLAAAALLGVYALARALPDTWWLVAAGAAAVLSVVLSWLAPLLLEPVFNRFTPMPEGGLRTALLALAERDGIAVRDVLVADASRRTTALNAYVSGFGATRRVVVYDTMLAPVDGGGAAPREIELVVAHELGHVKHRDVLRGTVLGAAGAAAGTLLLAAAATWDPLLEQAGADRFADPRSAVLLAALASLLGALAGPVGRAASRRVEARADRYALELTGDPDGFVAMQRRLSLANVSDVDPPRLLHILFGTHPSAVQRIAAAREYAARTGAAAG